MHESPTFGLVAQLGAKHDIARNKFQHYVKQRIPPEKSIIIDCAAQELKEFAASAAACKVAGGDACFCEWLHDVVAGNSWLEISSSCCWPPTSDSGPRIELAGHAIEVCPLVRPFVSEQIL